MNIRLTPKEVAMIMSVALSGGLLVLKALKTDKLKFTIQNSNLIAAYHSKNTHFEKVIPLGPILDKLLSKIQNEKDVIDAVLQSTDPDLKARDDQTNSVPN